MGMLIPTPTASTAVTAVLQARQLLGEGIPQGQTGGWNPKCTAITLPSKGVITFGTKVITLTTDVVYMPVCTGEPTLVQKIAATGPFYASSIPQTYVIAVSTVIAWTLLTMLMITPRAGYLCVNDPPGFSAGHGLIGGARGGTSNIVGFGGRPWLQKVATALIAICLTVVTLDTFKEAKLQYSYGFINGDDLRNKVLCSVQIRVLRVVSDIFLWLAQVQTLIRLFPRHREKVLIKWIGFALIALDTLFASFDAVVNGSPGGPSNIRDSISALLYLFELALGLLYGSWVIYYSLTKRRYAYYHPKMKSMPIVATLSLVSVLTPVVFFVVDLTVRNVDGWGDYMRWIGAAAAAVVVWEWVERIEALEREEKKDGILGREIFDGDEMLDLAPTQDLVFTSPKGSRSRFWKRDGAEFSCPTEKVGANCNISTENGLGSFPTQVADAHLTGESHGPVHQTVVQRPDSQVPYPERSRNRSARSLFSTASGRNRASSLRQHHRDENRPRPTPTTVSTISRLGTISPASTDYVVHYHTTEHATNTATDHKTPAETWTRQRPGMSRESSSRSTQQVSVISPQDPEKGVLEHEGHEIEPSPTPEQTSPDSWYAAMNPFKRKRAALPREVQAVAASKNELHVHALESQENRKDFKKHSRRRTEQAHRSEHRRPWKLARTATPEDGHPVMVIPAPSRGSERVWTPDEQMRLEQRSPEGPSRTPSGDTAVTTASRSPTADTSTRGCNHTSP